MCLVAIAHRTIDAVPVFVAANREESYARPATPPQSLPGDPAVVCPVDQQAGGTWLGVNARGVVVGVTNREKTELPAEPRSRGLLCRDLLGCESARAAAEAACRELESHGYAGCNLFCVDRDGAYVVHGGDCLQVFPLPPGWHVLAAGNVNDFHDPRVVRAYDCLRDARAGQLSDWIGLIERLCRAHQDGGPAICLHLDGGGTVSSSIVGLSDRVEGSVYLHSPGPPCSTPYADCSHLVQEILDRSSVA